MRLQSIKTRLVLFALVCAVPAVVFSLVQLRRDVQDMREDAVREAHAALEMMQTRISLQLAAAEVAGQLAGVMKPSDAPDTRACDAALKRAIVVASYARAFSLVDGSGRLSCSSAPGTLGISVANRPLYQSAVRLKRPVLGDFVRSIADERPSLVLAVPILDESREVAGVAISVFDAPALTAGIVGDDRLMVALLDRHGVLVSRSSESAQVPVGRTADSGGAFERVRDAKEPIQLAWLDERERLYAARPMRFRGETVLWAAAGVDTNAVQMRALAHLAAQAPIVIAVVIAVVLLAVAATRPLVLGRVRGLLTASHEVGAGRYGSRVRIDVNDELATVESAFNQMLDTVEADRSCLEQRVAERTRELAIANEELQSFSFSVSHDLRGPVAVVRTFSQILLEKDLVAGQDLHHLERIKAAADHMNELIEALLDLSRLGRATLDLQRVDLSLIAREVAQECRDATGRELDVRVAPDGHATGDPGLLRVVMSNLLGNAWKFTRDATDPRVEVGFEPNGSECAVTVRDNGAGFDEAYAANLFQPFQRLHSTREFTGLGIGLATVYRIVTRHGGTIRASGRVGEGAAFRFTLPAAMPSTES